MSYQSHFLHPKFHSTAIFGHWPPSYSTVNQWWRLSNLCHSWWYIIREITWLNCVKISSVHDHSKRSYRHLFGESLIIFWPVYIQNRKLPSLEIYITTWEETHDGNRYTAHINNHYYEDIQWNIQWNNTMK